MYMAEMVRDCMLLLLSQRIEKPKLLRIVYVLATFVDVSIWASMLNFADMKTDHNILYPPF